MRSPLEFLRISSVVLVVGIMVLGVWIFGVEPNLLTVKRIEIELPALPPELDGLRIAFLSDLHAFPRPDHPKLLRRIAKLVQKAHPHLILFGGDFVHGVPPAVPEASLTDLTEYLKGFSAPLGCFAVLGNHELWHDRNMIRRSVEAAGCSVLTGELRPLTFRGREFLLLGIDDYSTSPMGKNTVPPGLPEEGTMIVLAHAPGSAKFLPPHRNVPMFSGHTHGLQIRIPGCGPLRSIPVRSYPVDEEGNRPDRDPDAKYEYNYDRGLYTLRGNRIFVTSGAGGDRITARLGCIPEIVFATLRCPGKASAPELPQQLRETRKKDHEVR